MITVINIEKIEFKSDNPDFFVSVSLEILGDEFLLSGTHSPLFDQFTLPHVFEGLFIRRFREGQPADLAATDAVGFVYSRHP